MAQNEVMAMELTEESETEVKDIYCRFYCYDGTEANVQDAKISQKQMEEILSIINR